MFKFYRIVIFSVVCCGLWGQAEAQLADMTFDHITIEDGLSQSTVFAITQDDQGFMWFGTRDGLNRYDATRLSVFRNNPNDPGSISDNTVYALLTDSDKRFWIGTRHGLNLYDAGTDAFMDEVYYADTREKFHNTVNCLYEDKAGNIWVGTRDGLYRLVEGDTFLLVAFRHDEQEPNSLVDNDVRSIYQDSKGILWIGTAFGLSRLDFRGVEDYSFQSFVIPGGGNQSLKNNWINTITEDNGEKMLLIGTEKTGLLFFDPGRLVFFTPPGYRYGVDSKTIRNIVRGAHGTIWVGSIGGVYVLSEELALLNKLTNSPENNGSISDNSVRSIFFSRAGLCWIGGYHGGVSFYSPLANRFGSIMPGPVYPDLRFKVASALAVDEHGNMWVGTEGDGLYFLDKKNKTTRHFRREANRNSLSHDNIKCFLLEKGGIWIGTIKGLDYYNFKLHTFTHYLNSQDDPNSLPDDAVYDIERIDDETLWIATFRGGLIKFSTRTGKAVETFRPQPSVPFSISSEGITRLHMEKDSTLWVGTLSGLNRKEPGQNLFTRFMPGDRDNNYVLCLFEDSDKQLWIGTRGKGLNLLNKDGKSLSSFTTTEGLPGNSIYGILEDDNGYLWLSTDNGLSRMDRKRLVFRNFNRHDGLICKEFNFNSFAKDDRGYFYFGGYNGIVSFHPDSIHENNAVPPVVFTGLKVFNEAIRPSQAKGAILRQTLMTSRTLELKYDQNIFSVEFAVLNFVKASKNQFAYKLVGFEDDWNIVKEPLATYMNLKPGTYTLLVKGANNDGVWNEVPLSLTLKVLPPPWKTWWAYTLYVCAFLALLYTWNRFKEKQSRLEHELAIEHLEKEKQGELHRAKLNFFTNIAHEIRTPLTLMIGPVNHIHSTLDANNGLAKDIGLVKKNTDRLMRLLNQLLDFQKQETGNVKLQIRKSNFVEFIAEIIQPFEAFAHSRNVALHVAMPDEAVPLWFDHDELTKVFYNLLVNAFKFTPGGGEVWIKVDRDVSDAVGKYHVKITIEDNGLGIAADQLEKIFHRFYQAEHAGIHETGFGIGLSLVKGIIELHHGRISVESKEATPGQQGYTRFHITLPEGKLHFDDSQILEEALPEQANAQAAGGWPEKTGGERNDKYIILVVEDNMEIRDYLGDILEKNHYEVIKAANGQEGWQTATEKLPDLILSDVMMGGMNGLDLVAQIKGDVRTSHIPLILLTARASINHQVEGIISGADDYLTKPFNVQLLLAKINSHLIVREKLRDKYCRLVVLQPQNEAVEGPDDKFLKRLMEVLEENLLDPEFNVTKLTRTIGMSRPVLFRKTKMLTGLSVIDLIRSVRLKRAEMLLKQRKLSVAEVAFAVGFNDPKYFSKSFKEQYGKSPSQYMEELTG